MNATYRTGDILATTRNGHTRYIRIGTTGPGDINPGRIYIQDVDAAGFLLDGRGRHLQARTLATRYRHHHRAKESA